ncbi:transglycosylase domain-containing protein [Conyzicola nivalis]|uniref:Carboxypeptidase n=1 Tax=Conyzicola nivalis TaxID=1477021 RepID=A0A916WFW4_9MICO|nr:transglycosylase domain-containing protein [Conyzicola nivalis]GGA95421.1 carboxypeptidase [Conyzicola nivalis]
MFDNGSTDYEPDRSRRNIVRGFGGLVVASIVAGLLVATSLAPIAAVTGVTARDGLDAFDALPSEISLGDTAQRNTIYATRDGQPVKIAEVFDQNREDLPWDQVSQFLKDAAVAGEDHRYYEHGAVDPKSLARAAFGYFTNTGDSGGSTIAMQLVKNIRVHESQQLPTEEERKAAYVEAIDKSPTRKVQEIRLAIALEKKYTKDEILLGYLNVAGFGRATYGVEAAAERYYSSSAKDVTLAQAASLIATVQTPDSFNLGDPANYPKNQARRDLILNNMLEYGYITQEQHDEAITTPIESYVKLSNPTQGCLYASDAQFFCDYVLRSVPYLTALGADATEREANWKRGGYEIHTSLDLNQQDVAQAQLNARAPAEEARFELGAAAVALQPGTGKILVMAQNKSFNNTPQATAAQTSINFNTDQGFGGSTGFQTGSTYKIFTLVDWLKAGHTVRESVNGSERVIPANQFKCNGVAGAGDAFDVGNDTPGEGGNQSVLSATARSVNGAFASMAQKLDLCQIRDVAVSMGVHRADGGELDVFPSSILGTNQIAPMTMAAAVSTIAANGVYCVPTAVDRIVDTYGKDLGGETAQCAQVIEPNIAATAAYALEGVFTTGTAVSANPRDGVAIMGKTGTTDGSYQNWLIGSTTKVAIAVWVGNIRGNPAKATTKNPGGEQSLRRITVARNNGANIKFVVFEEMLKSFNANPAYVGADDFPAPDPALVNGKGKVTPRADGD